MWRILHMYLHRFMLMYAGIRHIKPLQMRMAWNSYKVSNKITWERSVKYETS